MGHPKVPVGSMAAMWDLVNAMKISHDGLLPIYGDDLGIVMMVTVLGLHIPKHDQCHSTPRQATGLQFDV